MNKILNSALENITRYKPQHYKNMAVIGLAVPENNNVDLMSLEIGLDMGLVEISEVDDYGSVGEVKVINKAVTPLLILDGEEIIGSKQNRVVNATVIIDAKSEKIIPVSCTEAGRWNYKTTKFHYSNHMATSRLRRDKLSSVNNSLINNYTFESNQHQVWKNISEIENELNVHSSTSALNDAYSAKILDIDNYRSAFNLNDNQNGVIVYINGELVGLELIYNSKRYKQYHDKLLDSYIIDAIAGYDEEYESVDFKDDDLISQIKMADCKSFESVGLGIDYRITDDNILGSAVLYDNTLINASFFKKIDA